MNTLAWVPLNAEKRPMVKWKNAASCASLAEALSYRPAMVARVIPAGEVVADFDDAGAKLPAPAINADPCYLETFIPYAVTTGNQAPPHEESAMSPSPSPPNSIWPSTETLRTPRGWHLTYAVAPHLQFRKRPVEVQGRKVDVCPAGTLDIVWGPGRRYVRRGVVPLPPTLIEAFLATAGERNFREGGLDPGGHADTAGCLFRFPPNCAHDRYARAVIENAIRRAWKAPNGSRNSMLNESAYTMALLEPHTQPRDWRRLHQVARVAYGEYADRVDEVIAAARASVDRRR